MLIWGSPSLKELVFSQFGTLDGCILALDVVPVQSTIFLFNAANISTITATFASTLSPILKFFMLLSFQNKVSEQE